MKDKATINSTPKNGRLAEEIHTRFAQALQTLLDQGVIESHYIFANRYDLHLSNFLRIIRNGKKVPAEYLSYLVEDYDVSPYWLLTGKGDMLTPAHYKKRATENQ